MKVDVSIIGAGLMGTAIARNLSKYDLKVMVIEKGADVCCGASKATSAIIHTGFNEKPRTLKAELIAKGSIMMEELCSQIDVPFKRLGHLVVALSDNDLNILDSLKRQGHENKVKEIEIIDKQKLLSIEPNLTENAKAALFAKNGAIVSPYELAIALMENAQKNDVQLILNAPVVNIKREDDRWLIQTPKGWVRSKYIINTSGISADDISYMAGDKEFKITPIKGEEYILDKNVGSLINHIIVTASSGVIALPTAHGNLLVGTTSVKTCKDDFMTTRDGYQYIFDNIKKAIPKISEKDIITSFAGLRAMNDKTEDYIIKASNKVPNFINVSIGSPGVAATPAVAAMVENILENLGTKLIKKDGYIPYRKAIVKFKDLSEKEKEEIIKLDNRYGHVICRCETITEGEIVEAIKRGARTLDGIKYRVRAGMGRCQGGFCTPRILRIMERELGIPVTEVTKKGKNSGVVHFRTKELLK